MGKYIVQLSKRALKDLKAIKKSGRKLDMEKVQTFLIDWKNILELELANQSN